MLFSQAKAKLALSKITYERDQDLLQKNMISQLYINFPVPQHVIDKIDIGGEIKFTSDAYPGMNFTAKITAINSEITSDNRAMEVQATFNNKDKAHYIYPCMFLNIRVVLPVIDQVIVLLRNAISYTLYGQSVFVLEPH